MFMKIFKIREIHFVLLIIAFTGTLFLIGSFNRKENMIVEDKIPKIEYAFLVDSLDREDLCFVLFYIDDSDICNEMANNMENLRLSTDDIKIYKINVNRYPDMIDKYSISGVPSILIFRKGIEDKRILGVVSYSNLEMIYKRQIK